MRVVLVTGATGFLGAAVVDRLASAGVRVRATGRQTQPRRFEGTDYRTFDLTGLEGGASLVAGVDSVIHCAGLAHGHHARANTDFRRVNVSATARLIDVAARTGVRHFVYVSSTSVYGPGSGMRDESAPCQPVGAYAESKREAEEAAARAAYGCGLRLTILRMPTLYGRGDRGNVARLIRALAHGRFVWIGTGANRKSLLYCEDAARACTLAIKNDEGTTAACDPETFNVPSDVKTMREIVDEIASALGKRQPRFRVPAGPFSFAARVARGIAPLARYGRSVEKWLQDDCFDGRRFHERTGYAPAISLQEGIAEEVAWIRDERERR